MAFEFALFQHAHTLFTKEVPEIFDLVSSALKRKASITPTTWQGWTSLTPNEWLEVGPFATAALFCVTTPLLLSRPRGGKPTYWLTRLLIMRFLALIYLAAFSTTALQGRALFGECGIMPLDFSTVSRPTPVFGEHALPFTDITLELVSWCGVAMSLLLMFVPVCSCLLPLALWAAYLSILNLGTITTNYGWEWLTLELGFLAVFLCPLPPVLCLRPLSPTLPPPFLIIGLYRWCAFRLLIGAGMSKLGRNSSACWRELSCTTTHYETQPMPNPLAWYAHHLPIEVHKFEVAITFLEQLVLPWLLLLPCRSVQIAAAVSEIMLQAAIVLTGNYAWINFVGVLPVLAVFDDQFLQHFLPQSCAAAVDTAEAALRTRHRWQLLVQWIHTGLAVGVAILIGDSS